MNREKLTVYISIPASLVVALLLIAMKQYELALAIIITENIYIYVKYRSDTIYASLCKGLPVAYMFAVYGVFLGFADVMLDELWDVKAFTWILILTLLSLHMLLYDVDFEDALVGYIGMYGGFWSIAWMIMRIWVGNPPFKGDTIWVLPHMVIPVPVFIAIVIASFIVYGVYFYKHR